jgi:hypothetical protein
MDQFGNPLGVNPLAAMQGNSLLGSATMGNNPQLPFTPAQIFQKMYGFDPTFGGVSGSYLPNGQPSMLGPQKWGGPNLQQVSGSATPQSQQYQRVQQIIEQPTQSNNSTSPSTTPSNQMIPNPYYNNAGIQSSNLSGLPGGGYTSQQYLTPVQAAALGLNNGGMKAPGSSSGPSGSQSQNSSASGADTSGAAAAAAAKQAAGGSSSSTDYNYGAQTDFGAGSLGGWGG